MTNRELAAQATRAKLLETGLRLFKECGFEKMTVDDITAAAGVSKGTFYTYFKRKEDIIYAICREPFRQIGERFMADIKHDLPTKLRHYFDDFTAEVQRYGVHVCREWLRDVITPAAVTDAKDAQKWFYDTDMLRGILKHAVKNGELKKDTPVDTLTHIIISQLYGMMLCWCMSDEKFNPQRWTKKFCDLQLEHILKPYLTEETKCTKG